MARQKGVEVALAPGHSDRYGETVAIGLRAEGNDEMTARGTLLARPVTQVRRRDRRMDSPEWIDRMLEGAAVGHLAVSWENRPFVHSNLYWYDGDTLYFHTALLGRIRAMADRGPLPAVFTVTEIGRILPADTPMDFSTEYASVVVYGELELVTDAAEKRRALEGLMAKYAPRLVAGVDYAPMPDSDVAITSVYRLTISERVGKHNVKPAGYSGYVYESGSFIDEERAAGRCTLLPKELDEVAPKA